MTVVIQEQLAELIEVYEGLACVDDCVRGIVVGGALSFEATADGYEDTVVACFDIEMLIPHDFPRALPEVKEVGGKIASDYPHRNSDGTLCLAVPVEQRRLFCKQPTLLGFVDHLVIPYLYGFSCWEKYGAHPFDEAEHGGEGILRHYIGILNLRDEVAAFAVICFLLEYGYRGHHDCPCGSGLRVRSCHGPALFSLHQYHSEVTIQAEFLAAMGVCCAKCKSGELVLPELLLWRSRRLLKRLMRPSMLAQHRIGAGHVHRSLKLRI